MFKKLIIAVLTLGLLVTFSSAAISSDDTPQKTGATLESGYNPHPLGISAIRDTRQITFQKPLPRGVAEVPVRVLPPPYYCDYIDYSGGNYAFRSPLPDANGIPEYGMKFTPAEGYLCTLKTAYVFIRYEKNVGDPGMRVTVYSDDGVGTPGTNLGYVDVPGSDIPNVGFGDYFAVDLSSLGLVFTDGEEFHIGAAILGSPTDVIWIGQDDGSNGLGRSWVYYPTAPYTGYYLQKDFWDPLWDSNWLIGVDVCYSKIPYTNCKQNIYDCGWVYRYNQPGAFYFNTRFTAEGPETLKTVSIQLRPPNAGWGAPDMNVYVWGDNGSGFPDTLNVIAGPILIPYASIVWRPAFNVVDLSALNIIVAQQEYHVGWKIVMNAPGDQLAAQMDAPEAGCGTGRSSLYYDIAPDQGWYLMGDFFAGGVDRNWIIQAYTCKDEFAECRNLNYAYSALSYNFMRLPDAYGDEADYQRFTPKGQGCRIDKINIWLYWAKADTAADGSWLPRYTYNSEVEVRAVDNLNAGLPGALLLSKTVTPADYLMHPPVTPATSYRRMMVVDVKNLNLTFDSDVWVGIKSLAPSISTGIRLLGDDGTNPSGWRAAEGWTDPGEPYGMGFDLMGKAWFLPPGVDLNLRINLDVCCVPVGEWPCLAGEDWPTMGFNKLRQVHSPFGIGLTPECDLTKAWEYVSGQEALFNSPVIYKDTVLCYFLDRVAAIDVNTGAQIWQRTSDGFVVGSGCYNTPTAYDGKLYIAGGNAKSFSCLSIATNATIWTRNFSTHSNHFLTFGPSLVVDIGGTPYVIYADDFGWVYCVNANTGVLYAGWGANNPYKPGQPIARGLSSDGTLLYLGVDQAAASGWVVAIRLTTGVVAWTNTGAGVTIVPSKDWPGKEGFAAGLAIDPLDGVLYTNSWYNPADNGAPVQDGGVMYSINTATGATNWVNLCTGGGLGPSYTVPAIDAGTVIYQSWTPWLSSGQLRGPMAFNRGTGAYVWSFTEADPIPNPGWGDGAMMEGLLTCETESFDWYVSQTRCNFLNFHNADLGTQVFHRRYTGYLGTTFSRAGHRVSPVMDEGHLIVTWRNKMVCLTKQTERPRLELPNYVIQLPVEFGSPNPTIVTFPDAIRNTGCIPLTLDSINIYNEDNNTSPVLFTPLSAISEERLNAMNVVSDKFTSKASRMMESFLDDQTLGKASDEMMNKSMSVNNAAGTVPAFVNGVVSPITPTTVAPGVTIPIALSVNGGIISRGLHTFYAQVWTDDPDYFLDSARIDKDLPIHGGKYAAPQIELGLIGGCLYGAKRLEFGMTASVNIENVWNSGMLANGDSAISMRISGDAGSFWQGALVFASGHYKVALHSQPWDGSVWQWKSLLSDPDCINGACPPQLLSNQLLGTISNDLGASYTNVFGNVVTFAFVDSVQDLGEYDTTGGYHLVKWHWDWPQNYTADAPYDDTLTIGFHACAKVIGAKDVPALANFTIHKYELTSRNGVPIPDFYMGMMMDYDVAPNNKNQITGYDKAHSVAYVYDCGTPTTGWGAVKVPFGCRYESMLMAKTVEARPGGPWNDSAWWLDSVYLSWMKVQRGLTHQPNTYPCIPSLTDRDAWFTYEGATIPASGSITFGFGQFGLVGITNANLPESYFGISNTINQWCGFGRGDVNNDGKINLVDVMVLKNYTFGTGNGPYPFKHLGDVDADGVVGAADVTFLMNYYFNFGECPRGAWTL